MDKQGYSLETIRLNRTALKVLAERGAALDNPESVKEVIAKQKSWSEARKRNVINAYTLFLKLQGLTWEKPKTNVTQKFPFIPKEEEIDALVSGTGPKTATFLQLLKETAMRCGEAKRLLWINIDIEKNTITLNDPEKGSNARMWKVSQKLIGMLNALPRESQKVFGDGSINSMKVTFQKARKRLSMKLQNPRLLEISFHTLRHWKATYEYHRTHDPYYVKQFLGHKSLKNTEIYINIERTLFEPGSDEFTVKVAEKPEEVKSLLEVGFEYVCQKEGLIFLRKRK
jgi:integrase